MGLFSRKFFEMHLPIGKIEKPDNPNKLIGISFLPDQGGRSRDVCPHIMQCSVLEPVYFVTEREWLQFRIS